MNIATSQNPYDRPPGCPRLQQSVVVLMDVLGYTRMIRDAERKGRSQTLLEELYNPLKKARESLQDANIEYINDVPPPRFALKAFTDNIVMGWPLQTSTPPAIGQALRDALVKISNFQLDLATKGFFVRGAIAVGEIFIDDIVVYGSGLLDAYDAEREHADIPRIILHDSAAAAEERYRDAYPKNETFPLSRYICTDCDDRRFVNYLDAAILDQQIITHRDTVVAKLQEFKTEPRVWSKYRWIARYHNSFCDEHSKRFSQHKITCHDVQLQPPRFDDV